MAPEGITRVNRGLPSVEMRLERALTTESGQDENPPAMVLALKSSTTMVQYGVVCFSLTESPSLSEAHHSSKMTTVFISVAIILGIMLFVTVLLVLTVALRRVYVRKDRQHVIATQCPFDNASPPLNKRLKKPSDGIENFHEQTLNSTALTVLQSAAEDEARTPPPSEPITFLGTPPPPSYTDLAGVPSSGTITSPRRINSDFSPPSLEVDSTFLHNGSCVEESTHSVRGPLGVQYSIEPRVTGSRSPTPGYRSSGEAGERAPRSAENGEKV